MDKIDEQICWKLIGILEMHSIDWNWDQTGGKEDECNKSICSSVCNCLLIDDGHPISLNMSPRVWLWILLFIFEDGDPDFGKDMKQDAESLDCNQWPVIFDRSTTDQIPMLDFVWTEVVIERLSAGQENINKLRDQTEINFVKSCNHH